LLITDVKRRMEQSHRTAISLKADQQCKKEVQNNVTENNTGNHL